MELRILQYFLMVAREKNITRAAKQLHMTQPTLSRQLMQLEDELGKPLFIRGKRKIELTDEGVLLRRRAEDHSEECRKYLLSDKDAIVKRWIKNGASGWRLDVVDELPGFFVKELRENVKKADKDAVIIGEVWEDASNKSAYGERREYFLGI